MSLFDQIIAGKVQVTNLDATEDNLDNVDTEGTEVEAGEGAEPETQVEDTTETTTETETTEEVETTTDSEGQELVEEADEIETDLLEVEGDEEELQQVEQEVEQAEEAAVATESFLANLFAANWLTNTLPILAAKSKCLQKTCLLWTMVVNHLQLPVRLLCLLKAQSNPLKTSS